jgi:hypothetical protein
MASDSHVINLCREFEYLKRANFFVRIAKYELWSDIEDINETTFNLRPAKCPDEAPEDRRYDNVPLGQGHRTPRGAVIDECGVMVEWWLSGENRRNRRKSCYSATSPTTNLTWRHPGPNPGLCGKKPTSGRLSYCTAYSRYLSANIPTVITSVYTKYTL